MSNQANLLISSPIPDMLNKSRYVIGPNILHIAIFPKLDIFFGIETFMFHRILVASVISNPNIKASIVQKLRHRVVPVYHAGVAGVN